LSNLTWPEVAARMRERPVALLPIGATEAHGPHLPLDTDTIIANATAERAFDHLAREGVPSLILPAVSYTVTFVGTSFAGTTPVHADPFEAYMASLLTNTARQGYRALICCNAHLEPAHVERLQAACRSAEAQTGVPVRAPDQRSERFAVLLSDEFRAGARHAGAYETSIVMAARADAVRLDEMRALKPVWIDLPRRLREGARTFAEAGAELGYFGDPARSSPEEGERMLDALARMIVETYRETLRLPPGTRNE
jgi:creatinine amidohydrolase